MILYAHEKSLTGLWIKVNSSDGTSPEYHLIFREGPRLIRQDVLDLSKLLGDIQSSTLDSGVRRGMIEFLVPTDEIDLTQFDDLQTDIE